MKRLAPATVKFETLQESNVMGVVCKEGNGWINRSPTKSQNGTNGNGTEHTNNDSGLISYQVNGVKKTVAFYLKDQRTTPRVGDKVNK